MSLEDDLRAALHHDDAPTGAGLDARAAIAGARRRRRPRVAIATGATALAGAGILAIALPLVLQPIGVTSTSGGAPMSDQVQMTESGSGLADDAGSIKRAPAERIALCEAPAPGPVAGASGLTAELVAPASLATGSESSAVLRLTNPTSATIVGATTGTAAGFVAMSGLVAWHDPAAAGLPSIEFSLEPGASLELPVSLAALTCSVDDDLAALETGRFPDDLAPLPTGEASAGAAVDVLVRSGDGTTLLDLVITPSVAVTVTD